MIRRFALATLCAVLLYCPLRADYILSSQFDTPAGPTSHISLPGPDSPTAQLNFDALSPITLQKWSGGAFVARMKTSSVADNLPPSYLDGASYTLRVNLTDLASGESASFAFTGVITGHVYSGDKGFEDVYSHHLLDPATRSLTLGGHTYDVKVWVGPLFGMSDSPDTKPPFLEQAIKADVVVDPSPTTTPEPSALLLAGAGASLLLAYRRRLAGRWSIGRSGS